MPENYSQPTRAAITSGIETRIARRLYVAFYANNKFHLPDVPAARTRQRREKKKKKKKGKHILPRRDSDRQKGYIVVHATRHLSPLSAIAEWAGCRLAVTGKLTVLAAVEGLLYTRCKSALRRHTTQRPHATLKATTTLRHASLWASKAQPDTAATRTERDRQWPSAARK